MSFAKDSVDQRAQNPEDTPDDVVKEEYSVSPGLAALLHKHNISIALSSYESGLLYLLGRNSAGGINIHKTALPKPMGLSVDSREGRKRLTLACGYQIMRFENVLQDGQAINETFDACYVPRTTHLTGFLDAHDIGLDASGRVIFVNTRFNCLATTSAQHSFEPIWTPPFISSHTDGAAAAEPVTLVDEDRCHLNGLAMQDGAPKYVTAVSRSNTIDGWRDRRRDGGIVVEVESGRVVCDGLSMPHSPRIHNGRLYLLNAGTGEFGMVEFDKTPDGAADAKGVFRPLAFCPGFLRGLSFHGNLAFVGLSRPRYKRFEGLDLDQRLKDMDSEAWCGIQIIDLSSGACVDWFRIDGKIGELYDVEVIPGVVCPMAVPPTSQEAAQLITYKGMNVDTRQ
jgi:uncharacterized protein (TIGR03032 family)